jgi:hypothetical protein
MMIAATMPEMAAGTTTVRLVVSRLAPRPYDASRSETGTARIASSEIEAISGIVSTPTARPAENRLKSEADGLMPWTMFGLMNRRAKKPRTTLGMPASISRIGLIVRRARACAYSDR